MNWQRLSDDHSEADSLFQSRGLTSNDLSPRRVLDHGMTHVMAPDERRRGDWPRKLTKSCTRLYHIRDSKRWSKIRVFHTPLAFEAHVKRVSVGTRGVSSWLTVCAINVGRRFTPRPKCWRHLTLHQSSIQKPDISWKSRFFPRGSWSEYCRRLYVWYGKLEWCGYPMVKKVLRVGLYTITRFDTVHEREGHRTDRHCTYLCTF